jgi:putative nucleotidyltransferase with HDIG domain
VQARERDAFPPVHAEFLGHFADDLAFGLRSRRAQAALEAGLLERERNAEALRNVLEQTVTAIAATVECRDPYTANHESRVAALAVAIGTELGLDAHRLEGLRLAGMLHDVGKIKVPVEYLTRPGKLSKLEFEVIKVHPEVGHDILAAIPFPWPIADIVWQHHECLDGSGYPRGLRGDEILLESRILTVADIVESMSSARPYRAPLGVDVALEEITSQSGIRYDSAVVGACIRVVREKGFVLGD